MWNFLNLADLVNGGITTCHYIWTSETSKDALVRAIDNADENTLRAVLKSMCQGSEVCRNEAINRMLVSRKHEIIELSDSSDNDTQKKQNKKQKTVDVILESRFEKCENCKKTYDVTLNNDEACQTHKGTLDIDYEYFWEDDELQNDVYPVDPETDWRREEWPEGFTWTCCEAHGDGKPCRIMRHIPKKPKRQLSLIPT
ncbi:hypothetical protein F5Y12DRAFT_787957 [Xylaria sp. FL1777]|nr:hypothetical protein F5Y12DRAFT_787957 [Xylaria sp. FL1777]